MTIFLVYIWCIYTFFTQLYLYVCVNMVLLHHVAGVCSDLRYCVGFCPGERFLRMWNLGSRINDQTLTYNVHKVHSDGTAEIVTMQRYPRYKVH